MFTIAPVGSCRIATPLRLNRDIYGYEISFNRNYGYCHSAAEAVQQLKYIDGKIDFPKDIWPLVARGKDHSQIGQQNKDDVDLFIVEISSAKMLRIDTFCVQLNYLRNEYADFFRNHERSRDFWAVNKTADQCKIDAFLKERWSDGNDQLEDCEILRRVRMSIVDESGLREDIRWIMSAVPNVMFVTHVNAVKPDQVTIASRENLIKMVSHVVRDEGGLVYDPTTRMQEFGQRAAIEDYSDSLAHFTPEFCYHFFPDWYNLAIEPCIDAAVKYAGCSAIEATLQPNIIAQIENGKSAQLTGRLERLEPLFGENQLFNILRAKVDVANNDTRIAYDRLSQTHKNNPDNVEVLNNLYRLAFDADDVEFSLECVRKLISLNTPPAPETLYAMAQLLVARGSNALGLEFFEIAYFLNPINQDFSKSYIKLAVTTEPERLSRLDSEDFRKLTARLDIGDLLSVLIARGETSDVVLSSYTISELRKLTAQKLLGVLRDLGSQIDDTFQVKLMGLWRNSQRQDKLVDRDLRRLVDNFFEIHYAEDHPIEEKLSVIGLTLAADPLHRDARIIMRRLRASLLGQARTLYKARERLKLDQLAEQLNGIAEPLPDVALFQARLALAEDNLEDAMSHTQRAIAESPQSGIAWLMLIRCAHRLGDLITLSNACRTFLNLEDDIEPAWEDEVRRRQERLPAKALQAARNEPEPYVAYELFGLALKDPCFAEIASLSRRRIERKLEQELRALTDAEPDPYAFLDLAEPILNIVEHGEFAERALVSVGRKLVKDREFGLALPYWERALALSPNNENHVFQINRCRKRMKTDTVTDLTRVLQEND